MRNWVRQHLIDAYQTGRSVGRVEAYVSVIEELTAKGFSDAVRALEIIYGGEQERSA